MTAHIPPFATFLLVSYVVALASLDLGTRRIPNALTIGALAVAFVLAVLTQGAAGVALAALGMLVGAAFLMPFYATGGFGAGDVKALAAVGAFLGPKHAAIAAACTLVSGALLGIAVIVLTVLVEPALQRRTTQPLGITSSTTSDMEPVPGVRLGAQRFPYGLAIACGTLVALAWLGHFDPFFVE